MAVLGAGGSSSPSGIRPLSKPAFKEKFDDCSEGFVPFEPTYPKGHRRLEGDQNLSEQARIFPEMRFRMRSIIPHKGIATPTNKIIRLAVRTLSPVVEEPASSPPGDGFAVGFSAATSSGLVAWASSPRPLSPARGGAGGSVRSLSPGFSVRPTSLPPIGEEGVLSLLRDRARGSPSGLGEKVRSFSPLRGSMGASLRFRQDPSPFLPTAISCFAEETARIASQDLSSRMVPRDDIRPLSHLRESTASLQTQEVSGKR